MQSGEGGHKGWGQPGGGVAVVERTGMSFPSPFSHPPPSIGIDALTDLVRRRVNEAMPSSLPNRSFTSERQ